MEEPQRNFTTKDTKNAKDADRMLDTEIEMRGEGV
jgi:hypothetical protein